MHITFFGWLDTPEASYTQLWHVAASLGGAVSSQAMEQRFGAESARLLHEVLQEAVAEVLCCTASVPEVLGRFNGVYVQDGTIISLPAELCDEWNVSFSVSSASNNAARFYLTPSTGKIARSRVNELNRIVHRSFSSKSFAFHRLSDLHPDHKLRSTSRVDGIRCMSLIGWGAEH